MDPDLPPEQDVDEAGWTTGETGPTRVADPGRGARDSGGSGPDGEGVPGERWAALDGADGAHNTPRSGERR